MKSERYIFGFVKALGPEIHYDWSMDHGPLLAPFDQDRLPVESRINADHAENPDEEEWQDYVQSMVLWYTGKSPMVLTMSEDLRTLSWQYKLLQRQSRWMISYGLGMTACVLYTLSELRSLKKRT